jgi:hypothetical protein
MAKNTSDKLCIVFLVVCALGGGLGVAVGIAQLTGPISVEDYQLSWCINASNQKDVNVCDVSLYNYDTYKKRTTKLTTPCELLPQPKIGVYYKCWRVGRSDHQIKFTPPKYDHHKENQKRASIRDDKSQLTVYIVLCIYGVIGCIMSIRQVCIYRRHSKYDELPSSREVVSTNTAQNSRISPPPAYHYEDTKV